MGFLPSSTMRRLLDLHGHLVHDCRKIGELQHDDLGTACNACCHSHVPRMVAHSRCLLCHGLYWRLDGITSRTRIYLSTFKSQLPFETLVGMRLDCLIFASSCTQTAYPAMHQLLSAHIEQAMQLAIAQSMSCVSAGNGDVGATQQSHEYMHTFDQFWLTHVKRSYKEYIDCQEDDAQAVRIDSSDEVDDDEDYDDEHSSWETDPDGC